MSALALALSSALVACEADGPTTPTAEAPVFESHVAGHESFGAVIQMDETLYGFTHFDAARGLMAVHGWIVEFCQGQPLSTTPRVIVATPSAIGQTLVKLGERDQPVVVYRTETGAVSCALVLSEEARVASGMVRHDQVFTLASFKATWRGRVTAPDGSSHPYTEVYQLTADIHDPNNPDLWSLNASKILVH
jgi:hypothetical protein